VVASRRNLALMDLGRLFRNGVNPSGDKELLKSFVTDGDELAFEEIVARHGSMVMGVCRRLLEDTHDADDAFQATFLLLVRKARQLRDADRLGPWLYGVATRVASKARAREARRRRGLRALSVEVACSSRSDSDLLDVRPILDAELSKLSAKHRDILVMCLLEGLTAEEASHQLSCPLGTVKSRLARGREALRDRLTARGLAPSVALTVALGASPQALASPVFRTLSMSTVRMAGLAIEQVPLAVIELTKGVPTKMLHRTSILALVAGGSIALGTTGLFALQKPHAVAAALGAQEGGEDNRQARERAMSMNNMKQIMLAMHNYQSTKESFPPKAITGPDGKPKLSWRVELLPYLDQQALYQDFHLDEPWDSPHNKQLIARMPDVFTTAHSPTGEGMTRIRVFEGPETMFQGNGGMKIANMIDGTSNTVAIVASREAVPWTRPGDLPYEPGKPLPALDDGGPAGVLTGMADGSARFLANANEEFWRKLITPAGSEVLIWPDDSQGFRPPTQRTQETQFQPTPAPQLPTQVTINTAPSSNISPELDARLRAIEAKLDRLIRKLEGGERGTLSR
jgi:RNA polymerase sigma factor (sigma-70 family)